jgi:hypothetical protein
MRGRCLSVQVRLWIRLFQGTDFETDDLFCDRRNSKRSLFRRHKKAAA